MDNYELLGIFAAQKIFIKSKNSFFSGVHLNDQKFLSVFPYLALIIGKQALLTIIFDFSDKVHYQVISYISFLIVRIFLLKMTMPASKINS